jgi:hypothetical protein
MNSYKLWRGCPISSCLLGFSAGRKIGSCFHRDVPCAGNRQSRLTIRRCQRQKWEWGIRLLYPHQRPISRSDASCLAVGVSDLDGWGFVLVLLGVPVDFRQVGERGVVHFRLNTSTGSVFHSPLCLAPMIWDSLRRSLSTSTKPFFRACCSTVASILSLMFRAMIPSGLRA